MASEIKRSWQNHTVEWVLSSRKEYTDPFNDVKVSAVFTDPHGEEKVLPAFWSGGNFWGIRFASHRVGRHHFCILCSDKSNSDLNNQKGTVEILPYIGDNPLLKHGPLRISQSRTYLEHVDGKPFFWLGDTWWMGLTKRFLWPKGFKLLTADRVKKGFTVIQIVAGLYPEMAPFDSRGANEAGFPYEKDYSRINPAYFDMADRRIDWLVQNGLVPCIVGSWGFFIEFAGEEVIKRHWRNLVARYGAYPVVWCVAGEAVMPYYHSSVLSNNEKGREYVVKARAGWTRVTQYLRSLDPYHHPVTIHPTDVGRNMVDDHSVLDIDMLQTGHEEICFANTVDKVVNSIVRTPRMPVLVGEVTYEGIKGESWENIQRLMFWTSILNGAAGHTYGANGIWQFNTKKKPFGPEPYGQSWGEIPWEEAYKLPGSRQVGLGRCLLERYSWWDFEPHLEWIEPHWDKNNYFQPYAAGIPKKVRIVYIPTHGSLHKIKEVEHGITYHAFYFNPRNGREYDLGTVVPNEKGEWIPPKSPIVHDWVLLIEAKN